MGVDTEWCDVGNVENFKEGYPVRVDIGEYAIAIYRLGDEIYAIGDICPHQKSVRLSEGFLDGNIIECPRHQSCFDVRTGEVMSPPARQGVPKYAVAVQGVRVLVRI